MKTTFNTVTVLLALIFMMPVVSQAETKIVFAVDATWPPMEFLSKDKEIVGFSIDFVKAAGKEAGFTPVFKNTAWDGIFAGLAAGKYDAICSSVSITEKRKKAMDFSEPYFEVNQVLIVPKNSPVTSLEQLKGKKVGGQIGTTGYFAIKKADGVIAKSYDEIGLAMEDLKIGRIDGVVCDSPVAANYALIKYKDSLKIAETLKTDEKEYYGFAVKKGNREVLDLINKGIAAVKAKKIDQDLKQKWIGN